MHLTKQRALREWSDSGTDTAGKTLDLQTFITNSEGVTDWARSGFAFDAPSIDVLPGSACSRDSTTLASCGASVDNLFPENNYFVITVNGCVLFCFVLSVFFPLLTSQMLLGPLLLTSGCLSNGCPPS
jgi:hypothetical protein